MKINNKSIKELEQEIEELETIYNYESGSKYNKVNELKATLKQTIAIKEMIEESPNPYPIDIFLEIDERIIPLINKWLKKELGFPLDRLSAHIGRKVRKNLQEELLSKVNGNSKSLT